MNNLVMLVDPDGREIELPILDKNNSNYSKEAAEAFLEFAKSKEGQTFLKDFAAEGQQIAGKTYSQGKYDKQKLDISFGIGELKDDDGTTTSSANGRTIPSVKGERGKISIVLNTKGANAIKYQNGKMTKNLYQYKLVQTITHESFIHGEYRAIDYFDGGGFDYSNVKPTIYEHPHHRAAHNEALKGKGRYSTEGYDLMKKMNSIYGIFKNDTDVWYEMWKFRY